ncbi:MAG: hypothetical protein JWP57_2574, partial [Spirosoma sp.]|nr:hypothetical protein [Spirosoma sp.]
HQYGRSTIVHNLHDGGNGGSYAGIVGDGILIVEWYVKVYPDEGFFTGKIIGIYGFHATGSGRWLRGQT